MPTRAVDQEAAHLGGRAQRAPLQQVIDDALHDQQVVEAAVDHLLQAIRHHEVVALRHRLEHVAVQVVVEREHLLVERLPRVVLLEDALGGHDGIGGARLGQQRGSLGDHERPDRGDHVGGLRPGPGSARRRPAGRPPSRPWPARPRVARPPRQWAAARGRGLRRSDCPGRSRMRSRSRPSRTRCASAPESVPQPPMARAETASSSATCLIPKRTFRIPLEVWLVSLMGSLARSGAPGTQGARPVPWARHREHRTTSVILSSTFPSMRHRGGPHL